VKLPLDLVIKGAMKNEIFLSLNLSNPHVKFRKTIIKLRNSLVLILADGGKLRQQGVVLLVTPHFCKFAFKRIPSINGGDREGHTMIVHPLQVSR
jgi:hypothetical protein